MTHQPTAPGRAPLVFKATAIPTFAFGVCVHLLALLMGKEALIQKVLTPRVDILFGAVIAVAAVAGIFSWRRYSGGRAGRIGYGFAMLLLLVSVPIHLRTAFTWSTEYVKAFPPWYSMVEVPMFAALVWMVSRLKFDRPAARGEKATAALPGA